MDVNYTSWTSSIGDTTLQTMINNASLPSSTLPPAESLWKMISGYKKAQDTLNASQGTNPERLNVVPSLQLGPSVEIAADQRPFVRGQAIIDVILYLGSDDVAGNTIVI